MYTVYSVLKLSVRKTGTKYWLLLQKGRKKESQKLFIKEPNIFQRVKKFFSIQTKCACIKSQFRLIFDWFFSELFIFLAQTKTVILGFNFFKF